MDKKITICEKDGFMQEWKKALILGPYCRKTMIRAEWQSQISWEYFGYGRRIYRWCTAKRSKGKR